MAKNLLIVESPAKILSLPPRWDISVIYLNVNWGLSRAAFARTTKCCRAEARSSGGSRDW
jgi:hypothetical protein